MDVFFSSTCYDLVDLRAETHEELRDLGVSARFSDIKESDFETPGDALTNSIEACLVNLRSCEVVILVLSQRYGPLLPKPFPTVSATHLEYNEAINQKKTIHFYIRDRLVADWAAWNRNGRSDNYRASWVKQEDAKGLFGLIEDHKKLVRGDGEANRNNWFWPFANSVDLRADIRRRLAPMAFRATGEKLAKAGQAPILLVQGQGLQNFRDGTLGMTVRFGFSLVNAGNVPAIRVSGRLEVSPDTVVHGAADARLPTVLPGSDTGTRPANISFDIQSQQLHHLFEKSNPANGILECDLVLSYGTPSGHIMEDRTRCYVRLRQGEPEYSTQATYVGKRITGMEPLLLND